MSRTRSVLFLSCLFALPLTYASPAETEPQSSNTPQANLVASVKKQDRVLSNAHVALSVNKKHRLLQS